jgi:hypothetical protein
MRSHRRDAPGAPGRRRAILNAVQDRLEREIAEFKVQLDRMLEEERERARRARGETWHGRID